MDDALWQMSACELQRRYRDASLTPLAVTRAVLARMDAVNPRLHAVVARRDEAVLAAAAAATKRHAEGAPLSVLDGIPLTVKDSLFTADLPTTCGTAALRDHRPAHDELAAGRALAGGALMIGKTNVPEFANDGYTANPLFGATGNPWNPALTPGGSSGGAVAAVAAGIGPLAIAQDGGGSCRRSAGPADCRSGVRHRAVAAGRTAAAARRPRRRPSTTGRPPTARAVRRTAAARRPPCAPPGR